MHAEPGSADETRGAPADLVERLLGARHALPRREVSDRAGMSLLHARRFWHALGFPSMGDDTFSFTDADLEAIDRVVGLEITGRFDDAMMLAMTRAFARTGERLATWQMSIVSEVALGGVLEEGAGPPPVPDLAAALADVDAGAEADLWGNGLSPELRAAVADFLVDSADQLEPLIVYAWRRHLAAAVGSLVGDGLADAGPAQDRCVGFADIVDFTGLVARLSERQLSRLVGRFEAHATDIVTAHGGRVIKTLGDEVVFSCTRAGPAAGIALDLSESMTQDPAMPALRVGVASGPVLLHLGDIFGTTVNRASRLCVSARSGSVVLDAATNTRLADVPGFETSALAPRALRGLGVTPVWELRRTPRETRPGPVTGAPADEAGRNGTAGAPG